MRAFRFGFALAAAVALSGNATRDGGPSLSLTQTDPLTREYDQQLKYALDTMVASAEIDADGTLLLTSALGDSRFLEPNSGYYWQISGGREQDFRSRSLWDRRLNVSDEAATEPLYYNSSQFPDEPLRVIERTVRLPGSDVEWQFVAARSRNHLD